MKYYSSKGFIIPAMLCFLAAVGFTSYGENAITPFCLLAIIAAYFIWMWYDTYYIIEGSHLFYKSALYKGSVDINTIVEIVKNKKMFSGIKASLSTKGIVIKYNKWDDIYISPKNADQFINTLKNINPNIIIKE